jgi:hypothetical protein
MALIILPGDKMNYKSKSRIEKTTLTLASIILFGFFTLSYGKTIPASTKNCNNKNKSTEKMSGCKGRGMDMKESKGHESMNNEENLASNLEKNENIFQNKLIREGIIDLAQIDENRDGKVFQCSMHSNIISDTKQDYPKCGRNLVEISIDDAKEKLIKEGYK